jgi:hypothetical protein
VAAGCQQVVLDGSFEATANSPWSEASSNSLPIICTPGSCGTGGGTAGPRSGIHWAWMGGISGVQETGSVSQTVTIQTGSAELSFWLWIGASSGNQQDRLRVFMDTDPAPYVTVHEGDPGYTGGYAEVVVDVSAVANGASHTLKIEATTQGNGVTNFSVDDVSLVACPPPDPTISVGDASVNEADTTVQATFAVSLSNASTQQVTVDYATGPASSGVPATPGVDFTPATGTLTFAAGETMKTVTVDVLGDTIDEPAETFALNLGNPTNASLGDAQGVATITDDDPPPALSVADASVAEGDSGIRNASFVVSLSQVSGFDVTVSYGTSNGTATAPSDYTATAGTLTLPAGTPSTTVEVPVLGDTNDEVDEAFSLGLASPVNATLADSVGICTIVDDDGPSVSINDTSVTEGNTGTTNAVFTVRLSAPSPQTVSVSYGASDGTAVAGLDYTAVSGTLTFAPGLTLRTLAVPVIGDVLDEANETFHVELSNPVDASLADAFGLGKILDDDGGVIALEGDLVHGSVRWEDLAALPGPTPDQDVYLLERPPRSSFEVVVDGISADVSAGSGPLLQRLGPDMSTPVQNSVPIGAGFSRSLRMENLQGVPVTDYIRVQSAGCGTGCDANDVYRIRAWETTLAMARFNNSASQLTIVTIGNATPDPVAGTLWFWGASGALLGSSGFTLPGRGMLVLNTSAVPGVSGQGGSITVSHDGPYGALVGKAVAAEPSTGFSFDTPLVPRPR